MLRTSLSGRVRRSILATGKQDHRTCSMPAFYQIDKQHKLVKSTATGVLTLADVASHREKLLNDSDFDPSFSQLIDVTGVTDVAIGTDDVRGLSVTTIFSANSRRSFLVKTDVQYGLARMFG